MEKRYAKVVSGVIEHIAIFLNDQDAATRGYIPLDPVVDVEIGIGDRHNGTNFFKPAPPLPSLTDYKSQAKDLIDKAAGRARARYITVAPGQEATYQAKATEADSYVAAGRPSDVTPYPILTAEAQARNMTVSDVADLVRSTRDQWIQLAAAIEGARIGGKLAIDNAVDHNAVDVVRNNTIAQLDAI